MRGQIRSNGIIGKLQDVHVIPPSEAQLEKTPRLLYQHRIYGLLIALSEFPYGMGGGFLQP